MVQAQDTTAYVSSLLSLPNPTSALPHQSTSNLRNLLSNLITFRGWSTLDPSPSPPSRRSHSACMWGDDKMVVSFGFHSSTTNAFTSLPDVWSYTFSTDEWEVSRLSRTCRIQTFSHITHLIRHFLAYA